MNDFNQMMNNEKNGPTFADADLDLLRVECDDAIALINSIDTAQSNFCIDKSTLAAEAASFYLKQRQRIFNSGFPSTLLPYLTLVKDKLTQLSHVFIELYKIHPGYIYFLKDNYPNVAIWTLLSTDFEQLDNRACLFAISMSDGVGAQEWKSIACLSDSEQLASVSRQLIQSSSVSSSLLFTTLQLRGELSTTFALALLKADGVIDKEIVHRYLVTQNVSSSCAWLADQAISAENVFEQLLSRADRGAWFRTLYASEQTEVPDEMKVFGYILDIPEYTHIEIDVSSPFAPIMFALKGDSRTANDVITLLSSMDEDTAEPWIVSLYIVFGDKLPVLPSQIGRDIDYALAVTEIQGWWQGISDGLFSSWRYGEQQSFDNTLEILASIEVTADFRQWVWNELCVICRGYFPWNSLVNAQHQYAALSKMKGNSIARERYNLRAQYAVMGY